MLGGSFNLNLSHETGNLFLIYTTIWQHFGFEPRHICLLGPAFATFPYPRVYIVQNSQDGRLSDQVENHSQATAEACPWANGGKDTSTNWLRGVFGVHAM